MKTKQGNAFSHRKCLTKPSIDKERDIQKAYLSQRTLLGRTSELQEPGIENWYNSGKEKKSICKTMVRHGLEQYSLGRQKKGECLHFSNSQSPILYNSHRDQMHKKLINSKRKANCHNLLKRNKTSFLYKSADCVKEEKKGKEIDTDAALLNHNKTPQCRTMLLLAKKGELDKESSNSDCSEKNKELPSPCSLNSEASQEKECEYNIVPFEIFSNKNESKAQEDSINPYFHSTPEGSVLGILDVLHSTQVQTIGTSLSVLSGTPRGEIIETPRLGQPDLISTTEIQETFSEIPVNETTSGIGTLSISPTVNNFFRSSADSFGTPSHAAQSMKMLQEMSLNRSFKQSFHYEEEHSVSSKGKEKMVKKSGLEITIEESETPRSNSIDTFSSKSDSILNSISTLETENAYLRSIYANTLSFSSPQYITPKASTNNKIAVRDMLNLIIIFLLFFVVLILLILQRKQHSYFQAVDK